METATIKLALNSEGIIDNWEEFIQCVEFQPYMLKHINHDSQYQR